MQVFMLLTRWATGSGKKEEMSSAVYSFESASLRASEKFLQRYYKKEETTCKMWMQDFSTGSFPV